MAVQVCRTAKTSGMAEVIVSEMAVHASRIKSVFSNSLLGLGLPGIFSSLCYGDACFTFGLEIPVHTFGFEMPVHT